MVNRKDARNFQDGFPVNLVFPSGMITRAWFTVSEATHVSRIGRRACSSDGGSCCETWLPPLSFANALGDLVEGNNDISVASCRTPKWPDVTIPDELNRTAREERNWMESLGIRRVSEAHNIAISAKCWAAGEIVSSTLANQLQFERFPNFCNVRDSLPWDRRIEIGHSLPR